jgi:hypothetical protein
LKLSTVGKLLTPINSLPLLPTVNVLFLPRTLPPNPNLIPSLLLVLSTDAMLASSADVNVTRRLALVTLSLLPSGGADVTGRKMLLLRPIDDAAEASNTWKIS